MMLKTILPIIIGAFIGYCTNYIAIKMLFRPRKKITLFGIALPFTPGVIPKNQPRIAKAVGEAVGNSLLTGEDILNTLKDEKISDKISEQIAVRMVSSNDRLEECISVLSAGNESQFMGKAQELVTDKIVTGLEKIDYTALIHNTAVPAIMEKLQGSMISMFVNEDMIKSFAEPIGSYMSQYMKNNGKALVLPIVSDEIDKIKEVKMKEAISCMGIEYPELKEMIRHLYLVFVDEKIPMVLKNVKINDIVEQKVKEMDVYELEKLTLSVMKNELQTVINLGAFIGAAIGCINLLVS